MTTKINKLDRQSLAIIRREFETALEPVSKRLGINFRWLGTRFFANVGTLKVELATIDENGNAVTQEVQDFMQSSHLHGVPNGCHGKTFTDDSGALHRLIGLAPRKHKYPFISIRIHDGRRFKWAASSIKNHLKIKG